MRASKLDDRRDRIRALQHHDLRLLSPSQHDVASQGRTVFRRLGKSRLPIEPIRVIDVGQMFRSRKVAPRVMERINRDFPIELDRAAKAVLARLGT